MIQSQGGCRTAYSLSTAALLLCVTAGASWGKNPARLTGKGLPPPTRPAPAKRTPTSPTSREADAMEQAALAAGEPSLQTILQREGYSTDVSRDEISAERFVRAGKGKVMVTPLSAYGLPNICTSGWYIAKTAATASNPPFAPRKQELWRINAPDNKRDYPPLMPNSHGMFDPGDFPFGFYTATEGFPTETVCTEDALQVYVPRFPAADRHKARVYRALRNGLPVPNAYIIGWEYSTNNDYQDLVTIVYNVKPYPTSAASAATLPPAAPKPSLLLPFMPAKP